MTRALVLNSGLAWAAYHVGALRHFVQEKEMHFDLCAGSGLGAVHAAFVACDAVEVLPSFWQHLSWRRLTTMNWRTPWRDGPLKLAPLKEFVARYVSERKLQDRGVKLIFNCLDTATGSETIFTYPGAEEVLEYPGASLPFRTAVHAAVAVPGLFPTVYYQGSQLADGAILNGCPLDQLMLHTGVERVFVVGVAPQMPVYQPGRNAFEILRTALEWNQYSETMTAIAQAHEQNAWIAAWGTEQEAVKRTIRELIEDHQLQADLLFKADEIYSQCGFPQPRAPVAIIPILPPKNLEGLFGDFKPERSRILLEQGRLDALRALHSAIAG